MDFNFLKDLNIDALKRDNLDSALRFSDKTNDIFKEIRSKLLDFKGELLSNPDTSLLKDFYDEFILRVNDVSRFAQVPGETIDSARIKRDRLSGLVNNLYARFISQILPIWLKIKDKQNESSNFIEDVSRKITSFETTFNNQISSFSSDTKARISNFDLDSGNKIKSLDSTIASGKIILNEARTELEKIKNFSILELVSRHGKIFLEQANKNKELAQVSFSLFIASLVFLIFFAYHLLSPLISDLSKISDGKYVIEILMLSIIFRLTLLSIGSIFVFQSLKNFNVNMHLYNLNIHRHNSLISFSTLIDNIGNDRDARNAIIKEVAQTIFSNQKTGYLDPSKEKLSLTEITDLVKTMKN